MVKLNIRIFLEPKMSRTSDWAWRVGERRVFLLYLRSVYSYPFIQQMFTEQRLCIRAWAGTAMAKKNHFSFLTCGCPLLRNWVKQTTGDNGVRNGYYRSIEERHQGIREDFQEEVVPKLSPEYKWGRQWPGKEVARSKGQQDGVRVSLLPGLTL